MHKILCKFSADLGQYLEERFLSHTVRLYLVMLERVTWPSNSPFITLFALVIFPHFFSQVKSQVIWQNCKSKNKSKQNPSWDRLEAPACRKGGCLYEDWSWKMQWFPTGQVSSVLFFFFLHWSLASCLILLFLFNCLCFQCECTSFPIVFF